MNQLKKTLFAVLGIGAAVGAASLINSPQWGYWTPLMRHYQNRVRMPRLLDPLKLTPEQRYDFNNAVREYRERGYLEPPVTGFYCTSGDPMEEINRMRREADRWKEFEAHVISEANRQEAIAFRLTHIP